MHYPDTGAGGAAGKGCQRRRLIPGQAAQRLCRLAWWVDMFPALSSNMFWECVTGASIYVCIFEGLSRKYSWK